jgi:hypothetical protein
MNMRQNMYPNIIMLRVHAKLKEWNEVCDQKGTLMRITPQSKTLL